MKVAGCKLRFCISQESLSEVNANISEEQSKEV